MNADNLDVRLLRYRSRRDESPLALAGALLDAGRATEALEVVRLARAAGGGDPRLWIIEGRAWFEQGDLPQAQASLMRAAKESPRDKEPYRWLAQVLMKRGEPGRAVQVLERALALDANDKVLQQAHTRAQRLARIAADPEISGDLPVAPEAPAPQPAATLRPGAPRDPFGSVRPSAPSDEPEDLRFALDTPVPRPRSHTPSTPRTQIDASAAAPIEESVDDAPTAAFEMPAEIRDWLEAERAAERRETRPAPDEPSASPVLELAPERATASASTETSSGPTTPAEPEAPEQVLDLLAKQGIFEGANTPAVQESEWANKSEARPAGQRMGPSLAVAWGLALLAAGGGYYGWTQWVERRRADARALITQAVADARDGEHASLVAAESKLSEARSLDSKSRQALEELLFVHAARALEDGSGDIGYLRNTLARAEAAHVAPALVAAAKALVHAVDRDTARAQAEAAKAIADGAQDARVLYMVGRLHQRSGNAEARALLEQAVARDPELALAWAAQAELLAFEGEREEAARLFEKALGSDAKFLRSELWRLLLDDDSASAAAREAQLAALKTRVEAGSASDKLLASIAQAKAIRTRGDLEGARAALEASATLTVADPEIMARLSQEAAAAGAHELAYRAASAAAKAAPHVRRYRDGLANVLLRRGDGRAVLSALSAIDEQDGGPWLLVTRARAALLTGSRDALAEAKKSLARYRATPEGREDADAGALLLRADLGLGANAESLLPAARALVQQAKDSAAAHMALGEAALLARQPELAERTLEQARELSPDDADAHYLLGRARRLAGKPDQAKSELEQAVQLAPSHGQAREALGSLWLDSGDYEAAQRLFEALQREGAGASATFGLTEALIAQLQLSAADEQLGKLDAESAASPAGQLLRARWLLAQGKPGEAVKLLQPLVAEDAETRTSDLLVAYGDALFASDKIDSAAGAYDAALELDALHPDALVGRAMAAVRAEKSSEATALLSRARSALDKRTRPPRLRAVLLLTWAKADILTSSFESARQKLVEVTAMPSAPAEAHFWLGETLAKAKSSGASESYAKYLELEPNGYYAARARRALAPR